ncbi:MAG: hypothetical protein HQK54_07760 [Oligoflexales bacterium]|nr:hypothetical protein [Oligoflexales bacterium]
MTGIDVAWKIFICVSLGFITFCSGLVASQVSATGKHVMILYPEIDTLHVSYMFLAVNTDTKPLSGKIDLLFPSETIDFRPLQGVSQSEIEAKGKGEYVISKLFNPGKTYIAISLILPAKYGVADMSFKAAGPVSILAFYTAHGTLSYPSYPEGFSFSQSVDFRGENYDVLEKSDIRSGEVFGITVGGIAEGRDRFFLLGIVTIGVLLIASSVLTFLTIARFNSGEAF